MYEWIGKLIGNATLTKTLVLAFSFPRLVWKFLVGESATIEDYFIDCSDSARGSLAMDEFLNDDEAFFSIPGVRLQGAAATTGIAARTGSPLDEEDQNASGMTSGDEVGLAAQAQARRQIAIKALLHQYDRGLEAMKKGFDAVVPAAGIAQMRWDDLQQRVTGIAQLTADNLLSALDLSAVPQPHRDFLCEIVADMSMWTRSKFLLFCTGQRHLPAPELVKVRVGDQPNSLPTAHTCSPITLHLPPAHCKDKLAAALSIAVNNAYEFGFV